jgi:hypothetical protein
MGGSNLYRSTAMPIDCLIQHAGFGPFTVSEWDLSPEHSLMLPVQPGDLVQSIQGTVWITIDGHPRDTLLANGDLHTVSESAVLRLSGFDAPRVKVLSRQPVQAHVWRDMQGWRHWLPMARAWARRRLESSVL